jgi:hypothetical protein
MREAQCETGWGEAAKAAQRMNIHPTPPANFIRGDPPPPGEGKSYTDAVVTPPSTTMVCPVMKLDASEAR